MANEVQLRAAYRQREAHLARTQRPPLRRRRARCVVQRGRRVAGAVCSSAAEHAPNQLAARKAGGELQQRDIILRGCRGVRGRRGLRGCSILRGCKRSKGCEGV